MCVPLMTRDRPWGAITLTATGRPFEHDDVEVASELARRAANAIENARLVRSLERSEERYRLLFEASPLPMWVYDAETLRFLAVNEAAVRHYGYTRSEFLAMTIKDIRPPEDVEGLLADLQNKGGPGSPMPGVWRHQTKDGTIIDVEITAGRVIMEDRPAALVLAHDVTERRRLEERLAPVGEDGGDRPPRGRRRARLQQPADGDLRLHRAAARAARDRRGATSSARSPTRPSRRRRSPASCSPSAAGRCCTRSSLDLNEIVAGMEPMVRRIIGDDVNVGVRLTGGLPAVEADRAQLERVILNLAANARDAMPHGGRLTIETASVELDEDYVGSRGEGTPGPNVLLAVSDTGAGHERGGPAPPVRAVLHDQGAGRGHRARPRDRVRRRQAERRQHLRLQRRGPRHDVQDLPAGGGRRRRAARQARPTGRRSAAPRRSCSSRTTRACATSCA